MLERMRPKKDETKEGCNLGNPFIDTRATISITYVVIFNLRPPSIGLHYLGG